MTMGTMSMFHLAKLSFFLVCASFFVWKVIESVQTYNRKERGTKVELRRNGDVGGDVVKLPNFAVCRHPNQATKLFYCRNYSPCNCTFSFFFTSTKVVDFWLSPGVSLMTEYNVTQASYMRRLDAYYQIEARRSTYAEVLERHVRFPLIGVGKLDKLMAM